MIFSPFFSFLKKCKLSFFPLGVPEIPPVHSVFSSKRPQFFWGSVFFGAQFFLKKKKACSRPTLFAILHKVTSTFCEKRPKRSREIFWPVNWWSQVVSVPFASSHCSLIDSCTSLQHQRVQLSFRSQPLKIKREILGGHVFSSSFSTNQLIWFRLWDKKIFHFMILY